MRGVVGGLDRAEDVLFGGVDPATTPATLYRLTWELEGSDWTERQDMGPSPRFGHGMTYDWKRGRVVLYGGSVAAVAEATTADLLADTWELPLAPGAKLVSFTAEPAIVGGSTSFMLAVDLDGIAEVPLKVAIAIDGDDFGSVNVPPGQMTATEKKQGTDVAVGDHSLTAKLGT